MTVIFFSINSIDLKVILGFFGRYSATRKAEGRRQKAEGRRQKAEGRN
ncbi:MAG: hypothetical protein F6J89_33160 [Symploca sp. SIO1C4]|uniref:Uncharacterized protein n=1 Tax=Symploca sp. SIO1C4 TaxID=2607765 RepID=A0A6B3NKP7_9CYAN|nr:hypothetical protein [Symploca sp. SIO1C4]